MPKLLIDVPMSAAIRGRIKVGSLQRGNDAVDDPFACTWERRQGRLGSTTKSWPHIRR
jgi:hypothetical protein